MILTNDEIFSAANKLIQTLDNYDKYLPAKINFYISKNKNILVKLAQEIEMVRVNIIQEYGTPNSNDENSYSIPSDKVLIVQKELDDLLSVQQEVDLKMIPLKDLEELDFTMQQMDALLIMIQEEE